MLLKKSKKNRRYRKQRATNENKNRNSIIINMADMSGKNNKAGHVQPIWIPNQMQPFTQQVLEPRQHIVPQPQLNPVPIALPAVQPAVQPVVQPAVQAGAQPAVQAVAQPAVQAVQPVAQALPAQSQSASINMVKPKRGGGGRGKKAVINAEDDDMEDNRIPEVINELDNRRMHENVVYNDDGNVELVQEIERMLDTKVVVKGKSEDSIKTANARGAIVAILQKQGYRTATIPSVFPSSTYENGKNRISGDRARGTFSKDVQNFLLANKRY